MIVNSFRSTSSQMVCIHLGHFPSGLAALLALLLLPLPSMLSGPTPPCPVAHAKDLALHGEDKRAHPRHTDRRRGPTTKIGAPWSRAAPAVGACDGSAGVGASTVSFSFVTPGGRGCRGCRGAREEPVDAFNAAPSYPSTSTVGAPFVILLSAVLQISGIIMLHSCQYYLYYLNGYVLYVQYYLGTCHPDSRLI